MPYQNLTPPAGSKISIQNGKLKVPENPILPFIRGDGTGPDIWASSVRVFDAAVAKAYGSKRKVSWFEVFAGELAKNKFDNTPLQVAMLTQSVGAAKALISAGADVNARMAEGFTALQEAASNGDVESIRLLLAAGADPGVVTPSGKTALGMAREAKHTEAALVLESALTKQPRG